MEMLWNMEQQLVADTKDGDVHHYVYDYTGERLLKGKVAYYSMWQDDEWLSSSFVLDAYTVFINPYAVVQNMDYDGNSIQWITNHYYSGMQRLASGMAVRQYSARPGAVGDDSSPVLDELEQHLAHFGFEEGKDYTRSSFEQPYQLTMQFPQASNKQEGSEEEGGNTLSNPLGACTGIYSDLYWYHPNYLGNVDLVTDLYGNVHQGFIYTAWGENMHEHHATTSGFNSPFRFNAKELDETGLAYYGARYYQNRYSLWLSVDPMASKYPDSSPYVFVANNPIVLIDPDGREIEPAGPAEREFLKTWVSLNFGKESGISVGKNSVKIDTKKFEANLANMDPTTRELAFAFKGVVDDNRTVKFQLGEEMTIVNSEKTGQFTGENINGRTVRIPQVIERLDNFSTEFAETIFMGNSDASLDNHGILINPNNHFKEGNTVENKYSTFSHEIGHMSLFFRGVNIQNKDHHTTPIQYENVTRMKLGLEIRMGTQHKHGKK